MVWKWRGRLRSGCNHGRHNIVVVVGCWVGRGCRLLVGRPPPPGRCRIVGFNARPLVFYVNIGGNVETPPKNLMELPRGHFLGSFLGHKKVPSRDLYRAQKKYPRDLFRAQKSTLGIFLGNKKVP